MSFKTKSDVTSYVQKILYKYDLNEFLNKIDFNFMLDLLKIGHHDPDSKIGCGISGIYVTQNCFNKRCFYIKRLDDSETDFSFVKCIHPKNKMTDFMLACRDAVREDIIDFRRNYYKNNADSNGYITCPFTKEKVAESDCHVDHIPPTTFKSIVVRWIKDNSLNYESCEISGYDDGEMSKKFKDVSVKTSFRNFHKDLMNLRITSQYGNLSGSKLENKAK